MEEEKLEEEVNEEKEEKVDKDSPKKAHKDKLKKKDEEIASLKEEVAKWKNEFYRVYADTQNLRNNLEKEQKVAIKYRAEGFIDKLLPIIDGFNLALKNSPDDPKIKNYLIGFEYIYKNFIQALESEGVTTITPKVGDKFDPDIMNALDTQEDEGEENRIMQVYQVGVKLHDRMVRHASVIVSKKPEEKSKEEDKDSKDAE